MEVIDDFGNTLSEDAFVIRHTEVQEFRNCQRKWYLSSHNGLNLEPVQKPAKLRIGSIWHKALEGLYKGEDPWEWMKESYNEELEESRENLGDGFFEQEFQESLEKEWELLESLLSAYLVWRNNEADPADSEMEFLNVERRLLVPLLSPEDHPTGAWIAAKLDIILLYNGMVYSMDHKTSGKSARVDNPDHLPLDLQMGLQLLTLRELQRYKGKTHPKIAGALYNMARKQKPGPKVSAPIFHRSEILRSDYELQKLKEELYKDYVRMSNIKEGELFPMEEPRIMSYNPQPWGFCAWGCDFRYVCEAINKGEDWQFLLENNYKPRDKDIWKMLEEEMKGE